jgi:hypothetical protein
VRHRSRPALAVPALAALAAAAWLALQDARGDFWLARAVAAKGPAAVETMPAERWDAVRAGLENAVAAAPGDPRIRELAGGLEASRAGDAGDLRRGYAHLIAAAALRPTSPYTWAAIAEARYKAGHVDAVFEAAMRRAWALGPAEIGVQMILLDYGLAAWGDISLETRSVVENSVAAAMKRYPVDVLQVAVRRDRLALACRYQNRSADLPQPWSSICNTTGAKS